jgi:hypothetical protein
VRVTFFQATSVLMLRNWLRMMNVSAMAHSLAKKSEFDLPVELAAIFGEPSLIGDERLQDYNSLFGAIAKSVSPRSVIEWLYLKDFVDITWQIYRERKNEVATVKLYQKDVVLELLKSTYGDPGSPASAVYRIFSAADEAQKWASDPIARREIEAMLLARGFTTDEILARAYISARSSVDSIQRRIESYEKRRSNIMRDIERRDETFARALGTAALDVIEGDYSEAAE